jgi:hypothetical protein
MAVIHGLFLCPKEGENIIVILTFIIKLHEVVITSAENCPSGCSTVMLCIRQAMRLLTDHL